MSEAIGSRIDGREPCAEPLHYTASGLDDVYLMNGFTIEETAYGRGTAIEGVDALHAALAQHLVIHRKRLSAKEFRFLRRQMDMTQAELAGRLGLDAQTVARYEKGETAISGPADLALRFVYILWALPPDQRAGVAEALKSLLDTDERVEASPVRFVATGDGWHEAA